MQHTITKSAKRIMMRIALTLVIAFAFLASPKVADAQTYCNPYNFSNYCYIYYLNFYNSTRSINFWNYSYGYSNYPANYTNTAFQNSEWKPGDRVYFYIYVNGWYRYYFHTRIFVDWNNDGDFYDSGEQVYAPSSNTPYNSYSITNSFLIPTNAPAGKHRMRVGVGYYYYMWYYSNVCGSYWYREWEDYTLNIALRNDAGVTAINSPVDKFDATQPQEVNVTIKNFSDLSLYQANVNYSVNGVFAGSTVWNGDLAKDQTATVTLNTDVMFTPQAPWGPFRIEAWTSNLIGSDASANAAADGNPGNDRKTADISCQLNDAGFISADAMLPLNSGLNDVILTIKNYNSFKPLSSVTISYSIDGIAQTPFTATFNPPIPPGGTADVTVGQYFFGSGNLPYLIEASTSNPNGDADDVPANDAGTAEVYKALQGGVYTIGPRESDYETIKEVMDFIGFWGLAGPVTFLIRQGEYYASFSLDGSGGRKQFPLTFESITRRAMDVVIYNDGTENDYLFEFIAYNNLTFRNLTFEARNVDNPRMFHFTNGNSNILFEGCIFNGVPGEGNGEGLYLQSPNSTGDIIQINGPMNNLEVSNCVFNDGAASIYVNYYDTQASNWWIHENEFNNAAFGFIILDDSEDISNIVIENNVFNGNNTPWGIAVFGGTSGVMIDNNRLNGIDAESNSGWGAGILVENYGYNGGLLLNGTNQISNNTLTVNNAYGVYIYGEGNTVESNVISATGTSYIFAGIYEYNGYNSVMMHNMVNTSGVYGIASDYSENTTIGYNKVVGSNTGYDDVSGVYMNGTNGGVLADNSISVSGNMGGLWYVDAYHLNAYYNSVLSNGDYPAFAYNPDGNPTKIGIQTPEFKRARSARGEAIPVDRERDNGKRGENKELGVGAGSNMLTRNIFQNNAGGYTGVINDDTYSLLSDNNNWWSSYEYPIAYNNNEYDLLGYQGASGQDLNSSSVEAMFLSATDLRLTHVNADLYYRYPVLAGMDYQNYEKTDLAGKDRTKTYYKGAYSIDPTIEVLQEPEDIVDCYGSTEHAFVVVAGVDYNAELSYQWYKDNVEIYGATGPILYINDPLDYEMGAVYQCRISGTGEADDVWTRPAMLYTLRPTEITRQPYDVREDLGAVALFEIDMHIYKEAPALYQPDIQWYRGGVMLMDNDRIAGTQSSIMTIRDIQPEDLGDDYYVVISGLCGTAQSENISLSEIPKLLVDDLSISQTVCIGGDALFSVTASSTVPGVEIKYQWMKDGVELTDGGRISGAMTSQLTISGVEPTDAGGYSCHVWIEIWDSKTTNASELMIELPPTITTDLEASVSVQTGGTLSLTIGASGNGMQYQWYKDGVEIDGATDMTYEKTDVEAGDEGIYTVKVYNDCGEVMSGECVLTVTPFLLLDVDGQAGEMILNQNSPNPFSLTTMIGFVLGETSEVKLAITDIYGRELAVLANGVVPAGLSKYEVNAEAMNLSSGVYYYTLTVNGKSLTKTMVVIK